MFNRPNPAKLESQAPIISFYDYALYSKAVDDLNQGHDTPIIEIATADSQTWRDGRPLDSHLMRVIITGSLQEDGSLAPLYGKVEEYRQIREADSPGTVNPDF